MSKNAKYILTLCLFTLIFNLGCKKNDGYNDPVSLDYTKPGVVSNIKVVNNTGKALITYTLPNSKNILYVEAKYQINDRIIRNTKSSYYSDSIQVSGFEKNKDYQVLLYTVSRANVKSDSVVVTVHPDTPAYIKTLKTIKLSNDFGGVHVDGINEGLDNIGVILILYDSLTRKFQITNQNYTGLKDISYTLRGYDTLPKNFGLYITDRWGNISDTIFTKIVPLYETQLDKSLFKEYKLPTDVPEFIAAGYYYGIRNIWNGSNAEPTYNTQQPISPPRWPVWVTFDMGQLAKMSRFNLQGRWGPSAGDYRWTWKEGTPKTWVLWGRADTPKDENMPSDSANLPDIGNVTANGWIFLGKFNAPPKPSGPGTTLTQDDINLFVNGFESNLSLNLPKIRYIRFQCFQILSGTNNFFDFNELTFYGDTRK